MNHIETTFEEIIRWLQSTHNLSAEQASRLLNSEHATADLQAETSVERAWYVKLLIGVSAWIAAIFLIAGVSTLAFIATGPIMAIAGLVLLGAALTLKWVRRRSIFWGQFAFALSLTGQGLLFGGVGQVLFDSNLAEVEQIRVAVSQMALIVLATQILLFFIFPDTVHRLLSVIFASLAGIVLLVAQLVDSTMSSDQIEKLLSALPAFLLMLFALGVLWVWQSRTTFLAGRWRELHAPLGYGFAIIMFGFALAMPFLDDMPEINARFLWLVSIGLALLLAHLGMQVVDDFSSELAQPLLAKLAIVIAIALLLIPLYETPGIWVALLALVLSFRQNSRLLQGIAALFLLGFISFYYYSLDITLLNKSYVLIGSGLILLVVRFVGGKLLGSAKVDPQRQAIEPNMGELSA